MLKNGVGLRDQFPTLLKYYLKLEKAKADSKKKYKKNSKEQSQNLKKKLH
ncbi:MAG: hypothetical protein ABIM17_05675 [candidate division WOR-3 bacterium]